MTSACTSFVEEHESLVNAHEHHFLEATRLVDVGSLTWSMPGALLPYRGAASESLEPAGVTFHRTEHIYLIGSSTVETAPAWLGPLHGELFGLRELPTNWDGHGGVPLVDAAYERAAAFVSTVSDPETLRPSVVPTAEGGVQIEWHAGRFDIEVFFDPQNREDDAFFVKDWDAQKSSQGQLTGKNMAGLTRLIRTMSRRVRTGS